MSRNDARFTEDLGKRHHPVGGRQGPKRAILMVATSFVPAELVLGPPWFHQNTPSRHVSQSIRPILARRQRTDTIVQ
jgi:hypothetical protein